MQVDGVLIKALLVKPVLKLMVSLPNYLNDIYEGFYFFYFTQCL